MGQVLPAYHRFSACRPAHAPPLSFYAADAMPILLPCQLANFADDSAAAAAAGARCRPAVFY